MKDLSLCCVYDNFEKGIDVRNNIEEFLIAAGKKKRPDITLSCYNREYRDIEENFKDTVVIEKDTWGYTNVKVNVDAPFIRIERKILNPMYLQATNMNFLMSLMHQNFTGAIITAE